MACQPPPARGMPMGGSMVRSPGRLTRKSRRPGPSVRRGGTDAVRATCPGAAFSPPPHAYPPSAMDTAATPTADELRAYREGRLSLSRFEVVDRWLAAQAPEEQERLLADGPAAAEPARLVAAAPGIGGKSTAGSFTPETGARTRFR